MIDDDSEPDDRSGWGPVQDALIGLIAVAAAAALAYFAAMIFFPGGG